MRSKYINKIGIVILLQLLLLTVGSGSVWGQTHPYAGVWYLTVKKNTSYYMVPAKDPQITTTNHVYEDAYFSSNYSSQAGDPEKPFITTYTTSGDLNSIWIFVPVSGENNYYYIVHALTGKYVKYQQYLSGGNARRKFVHLETITTPGETEKFEITALGVGVKIKPKNNTMYLNVAGDNQARYNGGTSNPYYSGIIGGMTGTDDNSQFNLIDASSAITLTPKISDVDEATNTFTITSPAAAFSTIRYTTDGSTAPDASTGTETTSGSPIVITDSWTVQAVGVFGSFVTPIAGPKNLEPILCATPVISYDYSTKMVSITCTTEGAAIHYTTDGSPATSSSTLYTGPFAIGSATIIRAIAVKAGDISNETIFLPPTEVSSSSDIQDMNGNYILASNFSSTGSVGTSDNPFKGTIDGDWNQISLGHPLVAYADGAIIKNVIIGNVSISSGTNVGAICGEATGDTRIYNCGVLDGSVGGSNNVGGIVGLLDGSSRVINCYNYADITSGSNCGGIVGYNNVASTSGNLQTMVMNCMFYGNITGGNAAPIYGGAIIHNKYASADDTGLNNYCYFLYDEEKNPYVKTIATGNYHGALGAEERFLNRFEFFRMTLNSTRNLAAFYATGDVTQKGEMAKWVLDKSIAPYPILKVQDKYPSVVNPDAEHATAQTERNKGGLLGTLSVTINGTGGGAVFSAPTGAHIVDENGNEVSSRTLTLNITDKDFENYNFNYKKIQLPYYNEVGTGNYTGGRVVTGWKITSITGGTPGSFTTDTYDYPSFNFVDRKCTNKDLYGTDGSNRVFAQGAYWEVPDDVTAITIEPYWAKAVYLSDTNYDMTYTITISGTGSGATATANKYGVTVCGSCPTEYNGQTVYTNLSTAITGLDCNASHTVYDYAVVLVGNYHQAHNNALVNNGRPVTFMSADLDGDNEPDNTLFYYHNQRKVVSPIRFDFLNIPGIGMVKRTHDATMDPEPGILAPQGWFEITNTVFIRFGQFEYAGSNAATKTILAPLILQGGIYEQFVSCCRTNAQNTNYLLIGGNAWFLNFANGCHTNQANKTPKVPINVAGGDYTNFYLTGIYQPASNEDAGNAECYIDGGRFQEIAGAGMQQVKGDVTWLINAADISSFYGGGINAAKPITGSISNTISNCYVDEFYGGPKFGDMDEEKTVITNATDCHFGKFFGAGYGGTAFNKVLPASKYDSSSEENTRTWNSWVTDEYKRAYSAGNGGISTNYEYEFILHSDGNQTVARFYVDYASLSLATTRNVTSTLSGCTIGTFYGGGSLGAVNGDVNSTLTDCTVTGNAFGAGFSASVPTVEVWNAGANLVPNPTYNRTANVFNNASVKTPKDNNEYIVYTWSKTHGSNSKPFTDTEDGKHYIHTDVSLDGLGSVTGNVTLTIDGTTTVAESVYGGGEESSVGGNTEVNVNGGTIGTTGKGGATWGNVYGGGKGKEDDVTAGLVKGNTNITISGTAEKTKILHNIYGGGAYGSVGTFTYDGTTGMPTALATENTGACTVTIKGGTIGSNGDENGMVFGSSRGDVAIPEGEPAVDPNDRMAWVYSTHVTVGDTGVETTPWIRGSVYGSGENGHTFQNAVIDIQKGTIGIAVGETVGDYSGAAYPYRGNVYGGGCGTDKYDSDNDGNKDSYNPLAGIVRGTATVNITGGQVVHNVYGAGAMGPVGADGVGHKTTVNINGGRIGYDGNDNGYVFGGARGDQGVGRNFAYVGDTEVNINYATTPAADNEGKTEQLIAGSVFGGGEAGSVHGSVEVNLNSGLVLNDVYGGGALADTNTDNWDDTNNTWADGKTSANNTTTVNLKGGKVNRNVYGGGLGQTEDTDSGLDDIEAKVYGNVLVELNNGVAEDAKGCVVLGSIFGCNNLNGTPMGDAKVHIYATQNNAASTIANPDEDEETAKVKGRYDIAAVYGGGNQSAYVPANPNSNKAEVIIDGCGLTSIQQVYGGGNAACTPATNVTVNGTYEIDELFGGGNGLDNIFINGVEMPNPGANVGYKNYSEYYEEDGQWKVRDKSDADTKEERTGSSYVYGTGKAAVNIYGGKVHRVFGGSNTKGNVRQTAVTLLDEKDECEFSVDEAYGGGKSAEMDAEAQLLMACIPGLKEVYGGAEAADVRGNVTLNITNGTFDRVFGGNNLSGTIGGSITINVQEIGCRPVMIGELYGGGNQAGYSVYGYKQVTENDKLVWKPRESATDSGTGPANPYNDPQVNVMSFSSIGSIYGGGYGDGATMVGNPTVNINVAYGRYYDQDASVVEENAETPNHYPIPSHAKGKIGAINKVFGGGNAAKVIGNTSVNIATLSEVYVVKEVATGASVAGLYTRSGAGTTASPFVYSDASGEAAADTTYYEKKEVKGADIRGDIFGGGNQAEVDGDTHVEVGKEM